MKLTTTSIDDTHKLGIRLGKKLKGDETIALVGNLGAGKTAFVQGLAKGIGATSNVISPTFVLERIYTGTKDRQMHHFDVYRIESEDVDSTGLPEILGEGIVVIEWADKIKALLPQDTIWINIKTTSETTREFNIDLPASREYVNEK